jgi:hemoglobin
MNINRIRLDRMLESFYGDVAQDELLGVVFNDIAKVDWPEHIIKLKKFWHKILFGDHGYVGNPLMAHQKLYDQSHLDELHFSTWIKLFKDNASIYLLKEEADLILIKANMIAVSLKSRIGVE